MTQWPVHGAIDGPVVMIGFGSIGRGALPLIERHFTFDRARLVVIDPKATDRALAEKHGARFIEEAVTAENFRELLTPLLTAGGGRGFCVNLSVDTSSLAIMRLCRELGALYIDTVAEPWAGFYFDRTQETAGRTNYALRQAVRDEKAARPGGTTAVSCCGANPGMVSWFVKQALVNLAGDTGLAGFAEPSPGDREGWAKLAQTLGVKGIHIAERDTQRAKAPKRMGAFINTWSVEGFLAEGVQPSELGWGTHEKWRPATSVTLGPDAQAIYLQQPGANTRVRSWCPTPGAQYGFLVTHNESISIADYLTVRDAAGKVVYRPTCHYAYHPADDAVLSLDEFFGQAAVPQEELHILSEDEIVDGIDELGVLLYGHSRNAYWYGSQLSIEETRRLAPYQNATGLQVTSAVVAGMAWALENPAAGIVETDEMDYRRCLAVQAPYLGPVRGYYTDWTPLTGRPGFFPEDIDPADPWQFRNVLVHD